MIFSFFPSVMASKGEICTYEKFLELSQSSQVAAIHAEISHLKDHDEINKLKKKLPIITWQASFPGKRLNKEAVPSGLFMFDIDHVENPYVLYRDTIISKKETLGILFVSKTSSGHGLRIVAKCRPEFGTLAECQQWLAKELNVEYDESCKDWARSSYVTPDQYWLYLNAEQLFQGEPLAKYSIEGQNTTSVPKPEAEKKDVDQREGLFGGKTDYKGVPLEDIAREYLQSIGGEPQEGERNTKLYKLATRLRYICDFNAATMLRVMPHYGLDEEEMKQLIHSALQTPRSQDIPKDLQDTLEVIDKRIKLGEETEDPLPEVTTNTDILPPLPPLIKQWVEIAPEDFKKPTVLCLLPILGSLGSRLRAKYLDGRNQSPSFLVSLEAPQASGKSFMVRLSEYCLAAMIEHDEAQREKEREYAKKAQEMKLLNIKVTVENKDEILGQRPQSLIRYVPATMSVTKLLMRMDAAQGLHLFALAEEVDTVVKTFKRGFSSYSDLLRVSFDNGMYGQDYASDNSFSGNVHIFYNMLCSGTPKAMRRMYPDVEDGTTSRVTFVTLPDQFGKPMPVWKEFTPEQKSIVDINLVRLDQISIQGDEVQPEHILKLEWLNKAMKAWIVAQQQQAVKDNDRTRDIFLRRAAVVGFRAGMLAYFLYGTKKTTPTIVNNVRKFAEWVANCMLTQHLLRFNVTETHSNTNKYEQAFNRLGETFTREDAERALMATGYETPIRNVLYNWKLNGLIEETKKGRGTRNQKTSILFTKIKKS